MTIDITIVADQEAFFADADTPTHPPNRWIQAKRALRAKDGLPDDAKVELNDHRISEALLYMEERGLVAATLSTYVSSVRFTARTAGIPSPVGPSTAIVLRAIKRRAAEQGQAAPIDWEAADLMAALAAMETRPDGSPSVGGLRNAAAFATMSDGMLRIGEAEALRIPDVERSPDGSATLHIRRHKTSKGAMGGGSKLFIGAPTVARIDAWLEIAGLDPTVDRGPLFRRLIRGGRVVRCMLCDNGWTACCRHDVPPHPCCRHPDGGAGCVDDGCCVHRSAPHGCCRHPDGGPECTGRPCCRHLGGCAECPCDARLGEASIRTLIKRYAAAAGVTGVNGHSFRVGSAISLARAGASLAEIMQAGRWSSADMVAHYIRREEAARGAIARLRYDR